MTSELAPGGMNKERELRWVLVHGTGDQLDKLGKLLDMPRRNLGWREVPESDDAYRARLQDHKLVQLLTGYVV
jgi:hypothetical protein